MENIIDPFTLRIMLGISILCFTGLFYLACRLMGPK
jgi:hypothetical protein